MNRREFTFLAAGAALETGWGWSRPLRTAPSKADFTLRIAPASVELAPGKTIRTAAYNGTLPGPVLRMKEGKRISVDLFNDTNVPELVHWRGQNVTAEADGAEEEGSPFVPPHGHLCVSLTRGPAGTCCYHTHAMAMDDLTKGAYSGQFGFLRVEPKSHPGSYDQEVFLAGRHGDPFPLHQGAPQKRLDRGLQARHTPDRALGFGDPIRVFGDPIRVKEGQRVLLRIVNANATRQLNLVLPGHKFEVIALDGNPVPKSVPVELLTVTVAERVDAIVEMNQPGVWVLGSVRDGVLLYCTAICSRTWITAPS